MCGRCRLSRRKQVVEERSDCVSRRNRSARVTCWNSEPHCTPLYFPMQNLPKIRLRMSSVVVAPVISSRGRSAAYRSSKSIS